MANIKLQKKDNIIEVQIKSSGEEWTKFLDESKKSLVENLELKGFRKGHVPANIAEQNISKTSIFNKAADLLMEKNYNEAIDLLMKEKIASRPVLKVVKISDDEIEASLQSIAMPEVKIGNRESIKLEVKAEETSDDEIKKELEQLDAILRKDQEKSDGSTLIVEGDIANIDYLGKVDDVAFEGGKAEGFDLKIGSKSFIDNFEDQLIGMKKGEEKTIVVKFPEQYPSEDLKGKEAKFDVKINMIKENVALVGDELNEKIKSLGFNSKDEIVEKINEVYIDKKKSEANDKYFREYFDKIIDLKDTVLTVPEEILKQEIEQEWKRVEAQVIQGGMNIKDYLKTLGMSIEDFKEQNLRDSSEKRIKDGLIYSQLIDDLGLEVSEKELEDEYNKMAENNKISVEEVKKQVRKESIEGSILYEKLIKEIKK